MISQNQREKALAKAVHKGESMTTGQTIAGLLGGLLLFGCAGQKVSQKETTAPLSQAEANAAQNPAPKPAASKEAPVHGHRAGGLMLRDGKTGAALSKEAFTEKLRAARAIYVGEQHNSRASHQAQLAVLGQVYGIDHDVALAIEMLPARLQPQLDAFLAGSLDEEGFLAAVDWPHTWGFDYGLYRPLFEFCRVHGLRIHALNAPKELSRAVRQKGVEGLSEPERALLPTGYPWPMPEEHRQFIRQIFDSHPGAKDKKSPEEAANHEAAFTRFYTAQLIWDESMAQGVAAIFASKTAPQRVVVLAGSGHVGPYAMPGRADRRGVSAHFTIGPVENESDPPPTGAEATDALVVIGPEEPEASPHGK